MHREFSDNLKGSKADNRWDDSLTSTISIYFHLLSQRSTRTEVQKWKYQGESHRYTGAQRSLINYVETHSQCVQPTKLPWATTTWLNTNKNTHTVAKNKNIYPFGSIWLMLRYTISLSLSCFFPHSIHATDYNLSSRSEGTLRHWILPAMLSASSGLLADSSMPCRNQLRLQWLNSF